MQFFQYLFRPRQSKRMNQIISERNKVHHETNIRVPEFDERIGRIQLDLFGDPELAIKDPETPEHDISVISLDAANYMKVNTPSAK